MNERLRFALILSIFLLPTIACGGGASSVQTTPVPSTITSVSLVCTPSTVAGIATSQCSAKVQGTGSFSSAVTWSVTGGSIDANGLLTAPSTAGTVTVTATSSQDTTKSGTTAVIVQAPSSTIASVSVTCTPATVATNATLQCGAKVQGTGSFSSTVTWSATSGSINANGLLTAPSTAGTLTVTATSTQDTTKSGMASVIVQTSQSTIASISATCTPATVATGAASQCSAKVQGTGSFSLAIAWSVTGGSIDANGLLTAPSAAGTVTVTATSAQDTTKFGTASVIVQAPSSTISSISVTCTPANLASSAMSQCNATVDGTGTFSSAVTWSATSGSIDASGLLTAPATAGTLTVTATSSQDPTKSGTALLTVQSQTPQSKHVVMVMEENQSYSTVVGNTSDWPNLNNLISNGALPTNYYANLHPSIGNYFMLTTGQLLTNDDNSTTVWNVDNIARRMLAAGVSFRIYAEGITQGYVGGNTGLYLIRHNPFAMLSDVGGNTQVANQCIWPFTQFAIDLANGTLPEFSFIVPDIDDDAHNGTPQQADTWLQANVVTPLSNVSAFNSAGDGVLIVDFDEAADSDTTYGGGHVAPVFWGPIAKVGFTQTSSTIYQHQSMLQTVMGLLGMTNPPGAAATAPPMTEFLVAK